MYKINRELSYNTGRTGGTVEVNRGVNAVASLLFGPHVTLFSGWRVCLRSNVSWSFVIIQSAIGNIIRYNP